MSQSKNHRANARLIQKIKEDHGPENPEAPVNYGEYDREGDMAKDDLYTIDSAAEELYSILQADENLPEWVQSKITKAVDYIDTARDYMKAQSYGQGVAEGSGDPKIPIGMKTQYGTVVSVNVKENTVTVKASNGELTTVNIQDIDQARAEDQLDEIGNTPAGKAALRAVQNRATDTMDTWSKNSASGYSSTPKQVKKATGAAVSAGNRLHGFGPDRMQQNTVMARDALRKDMAEGADFSAADKVEELVRYYKLFDKRGWTDLFAKLAGRKLQGVPEISREMEYASKFLDLLDSIRMRSDYRGQQDPKKDQELIDLSNQWLDLLNQAEDEFKTMSGQGMAEGSSENKYSNLSNRGVNRGINRAGDDFNRMMDLDQAESPHYKTQHQQNTKQRLKTKPMVGPKGVLPEQDVTEGPALSTSTLTGEIPTLMGLRKKEQGDLIEKYALYNREKDYFELFVELSGKPMSEIYNMNDSHQLAYELYNLGSQIASDWRNISNPKFSRREYLNQIMSDWYNLFKKSIQKYKSMKQGVAEGEDSKEIGPGWKTEHGIVDRVDGNSVIVKTSQGEMIVNMHDIKTAEAPEQGVAEGMVKGEYGRVLDALQLYYPRLSMDELNVPGYHKVVADKANVPVEYAAQVINDFTRDNDPNEFDDFDDDKQGVAEGKTIASGLNDWQKKALKHDTYEKYVSHCNRYNYPHMDKRAWQRYKNAFDNMGTQDMAKASFPTVADARKRAEQEKGTGKFTSKKNPDNPSGTFYTRKYNPKSGETDDTENVSIEKPGRGRPKKSAFEDMSTIDKMIAESFGELFEGTSRPINDPVSKAAPATPGVGSSIRVSPMPTLATPKPAKPAPGMGSIQGGVWTAKPPKAGEQGVPVPQGIDEGPLLDKIGTGIGKAAGSIVGGAANFGQAIKKGYQAGKSGDDDERAAATGAARAAATGAALANTQVVHGVDPATGQNVTMPDGTNPETGTSNDPPYPYPSGSMMNLKEVDAEMEDMRKLAGLKGGQKKLDRDQDGELTRKDFEMLRKGLEEGGRDDYDEIRDKIQWLQGAPNYLSRDEAKETAYYTKDTDPVWDGYRDDADEVGENLEVRANPAGASSAEQAKKIGAQFPQQNGKEPNLAYKIGEDEVEENLIVVPNLSGAGSVAAAKKLGAMMPAKPGEKDPISTNEEDMEEGGAFGLAVTNAKRDGIQPGETFTVGGKEYDLKEGDDALNQMRRIAGLKECDMSPISGMASDMEKQQGNMNISTSQNSDGTKSVTISADGDAASELMQMLKLAGMGGGGAAPAAAAKPEIVVVAQDGEETMEEEKDPRYQASTTPDEQVAPVQALTKGGNGDVAGQEKEMKPGGYQFGDNNLAMQESLSAQLMKEYNSIKVKK